MHVRMAFINRKFKYLYLWMFICCLSATTPTYASFFDWVWSQKTTPDSIIHSDAPLIAVPYEYQSEDEKFLEEASKFTDLMKTSSLDICQHKVILQIKTTCSSMTEEDLAKMSVNLLNCQSEVDGRTIFPCTESMSLKECTKDMNPSMWNAYHLMNNRARAVCLAARRIQFHALSEMTINKLMSNAQDQIDKMTNLLEGQEKLESITLGTLDSIEKGNSELMKQQEKLKAAQKSVQEFVTLNLEQLTQEKALIAAGNKELAKMTKTIKDKLDEASEQLIFQSEERMKNHQTLLEDIEALQKLAKQIFKRIDASTEKLLAQHEVASLRYKDAVENLSKINDTIHYMLKIVNTTRREIDEKFYWIQDFLDGTGNNIGRISLITLHIIYLLVGMLFASFLNISTTSRAVLAVIVPLNLFVSYKHGSETAMDFSQMTVFICFMVLAVAIVQSLQRFTFSKPQFRQYLTNNSNKLSRDETSQAKKTKNSRNVFDLLMQYFNVLYNKFSQLLNISSSKVRYRMCNRNEENLVSSSFREGNIDNLSRQFTPNRDLYREREYHRVMDWLQKKTDAPPSETAFSAASESPESVCMGLCRTGRRCKKISSPGSDFCHLHSSNVSHDNWPRI